MSKTGEFDLNFPGATIICDTLEKKRAILDYLNSKSPNFDLDLSTDSMQQTLERVIFNTTYLHEGRHLHDYLTAPLLMEHWFQKLLSLSLSVNALESFKHSSIHYKYLPLPFNQWLGLAQERKSELLQQKGISKNDVPFYDISAFREAASNELNKLSLFDKNLITAALSQIKLDEGNPILDSYNTDYSTRSFLESLAFAIQATEMVLRYGKKGVEIVDFVVRDKSFENFMSLGDKKRNGGKKIERSDYLGYTNYTSMFTYVYRFCYRNNVNQNSLYPFIAYMLFWGLCGDPKANASHALSPRNRLESFFHLDELGYDMELSKDETLYTLFRRPLDSFNSWDTIVRKAYLQHLTPVMIIQNGQFFPLSIISEGIDFRNYYSCVVQKGKELSLQLKLIGYHSLSNYINGIIGSMAYMADMMLSSASSYLYPEMYVKSFNQFVNVPFRFQFSNGITISQTEVMPNPDIIFDNGMIYKDGLRQHANSEVNYFLKSKDYIECKKYIDFCNVLFGNSLVEKPGSLIREMLPGIKPWFINV